jgi:hypothetical protein
MVHSQQASGASPCHKRARPACRLERCTQAWQGSMEAQPAKITRGMSDLDPSPRSKRRRLRDHERAKLRSGTSTNTSTVASARRARQAARAAHSGTGTRDMATASRAHIRSGPRLRARPRALDTGPESDVRTRRAPGQRRATSESTPSSDLPSELLHVVLSFCSDATLARARQWSRRTGTLVARVLRIRGASESEDELRNRYILHSGLGRAFREAAQMAAAVATGCANFVLYAQEAEPVCLPRLQTLFDERVSSAFFDDRVLPGDAFHCLTRAGFQALGYDKHACYTEPFAATERLRAAGSDSALCQDCRQAPSLFYCVELPARCCLCAACIEPRWVTKLRMVEAHPLGFLEPHAGGYAAPQALASQGRTRVGLFFSYGAQNNSFGVEFWSPPLDVEGEAGLIADVWDTVWPLYADAGD